MDSLALHLAPMDDYNRALIENLHPPGWRNPEPAPRYNLVVIGAGTAGLVTAAGASILGAKVALVERDFMGGDCLNFGCVPSKALLRCARAAAEVRDAGRFGVEVPDGVRMNFGLVMQRMRKLRAELSPIDSAPRFQGLGVDVFFGDGRFISPDCIEVEGKKLRFKKAAIATGARAASLPIPGLAEAGFLTNETVFSLTELPARIAVIGAGPIGCELAQAFQRFGAQVTMLEVAPQILIREDRAAAECVERAIVRDGVEVVTGCKIVKAERRGTLKVLTIENHGTHREVEIDEILIGVGRVPAVTGMNLETAMIEYDAQRGIKVDDYLRTTNPLVYAAGDVASEYKFTHLSDAHARILLRNALFFGRQRVSALTIPWCTYTDPEIAHVGLYESDAAERGIAVTAYTQELAEVDRAVLDGETEGFVKTLVRAGTDQIVGATIVAKHAGEMISELTTAIVAGVGLGKLADVIHPYPTQAEAIRRTGFAYNRTRLTP
ncbi:MAG: pyridine nucleotide-disulfide oxidoreductase dimerization region, partial [Candidatus Binatus sp.]|nr:pyridine nucleotide-disulfide oxidoreductase dimerization region [Candidatus Binatus sp.]